MRKRPTPDSPEEREDKARILAKEMRQFRWEIRLYYAVVFVIVVLREV